MAELVERLSPKHRADSAEAFNNAVVANCDIQMFSPEEEDGGTVSGSLTVDQTHSQQQQQQQQQQSSVETTGHVLMQEDIMSSNDEHVSSESHLGSDQLVGSIMEVKENTTVSSTTTGSDDSQQDDGLCLKGYRTLTGVVTLEQTISCTTRQLSRQEVIVTSIDDDVSSENLLNSERLTSIMEDKENTTAPSTTTDGDDDPGSVTLDQAISCQSSVEPSVQLSVQEDIVCSNDENEDVSSENQLNSERLSTSIMEDKENTTMPSTTTDSGQLSMQEVIVMSNDEDVTSVNRLNSEQLIRSIMEGKENSVPSTTTDSDDVQQDDSPLLKGREAPVVTPTKHDHDAEMVKRAQEEGCVDVVFPGTVTQEGCCRFVHEILKCVLYQRQQLPMTYDQLKHSQKCQASKQNKDVASWRPVHSADMGWRKSERSLQELDMLLEQLEVLFSLSLVPRVLLLLGGSVVLPKELYEINMEALILSSGDKSLRVSSCLRQLFRTLFVTDLLSDTAPVHLMATTLLVLAHRECGVGWFRPKLGFKVPTRLKRRIIVLSTDTDICRDLQTERSDWKEYVWFQAPTAIKGFSS